MQQAVCFHTRSN